MARPRTNRRIDPGGRRSLALEAALQEAMQWFDPSPWECIASLVDVFYAKAETWPADHQMRSVWYDTGHGLYDLLEKLEQA